MIGLLKGKPSILSPGQIIVEAGGVGYLVNISYNTYYLISENTDEVCLNIYTYVREGAIELYGFYDLLEKILFTKLITISGIGPRLAINILSGIPVKELVHAIENQSIDRLQSIPGIGKKTAERIAMELKDKIQSIISKEIKEHDLSYEASTKSEIYNDLVSALTNLGYKRKESENAINYALSIVENKDDFELALKTSLSYLSRSLLK